MPLSRLDFFYEGFMCLQLRNLFPFPLGQGHNEG